MKPSSLLRCGIVLVAASLIFFAGCNPSGFTVGGKVTGLAGELRLSLNSSETLAITKNGNYKFASVLNTSAAYGVAIVSQPNGQNCTLVNGSGVVASANISNVNVTCTTTPTYTVGGSVSGLLGNITISLNGAESLTVSGDGSYQFATALPNGASYSVAITSQSSWQHCAVNSGSGSINLANASVAIECASETSSASPTITHIWPNSVLGGYEVKVSGGNLDLVSIAFNGAAVEPTLQTPHELRFIAPQNPKGSYALELENNDGVATRFVTQGEVLANAIKISRGLDHNCAVLNNGKVKCWGLNDHGQLGNGNTNPSLVPVEVIGISNAVNVDAGNFSSCALLATGAIKCWGSNRGGQLGDGTILRHLTPITVPGISDAVDVSLGDYHACAVRSNGSVQCWGTNGEHGLLGNNSTSVTPSTPVAVVGISNAVDVSASNGHSCAALSDGGVRCWGFNNAGRLGNGTYDDSLTPAQVNGITNAVAVTTGGTHSCALLSGGAVSCWGYHGFGEITTSNLPVVISGIDTAVAVAAGSGFTCVVLGSGSVRCWGENVYGQLGDGVVGLKSFTSTPVVVKGINTAATISADGSSACALLNNGNVQCWGQNVDGRLGYAGRVDQSTTPVTIGGINDAVAFSVSNGNCALIGNGDIKCWGGSMDWASIVPAIHDAIAIEGRCIVRSGGSVQCWTGAVATPVTTIPGISSAIAVSQNCALLGNGAVQCWGNNDAGQLGDGTTISSETAVAVTGITNATAVSGGGYTNCARLSTGAVQCWGSNQFGQLGNGTTVWSSIPVNVTGINDAVQISTGGNYGCAVLGTGSVKCWGHNDLGQLGNGTVNDSALPVSVSGISNAVAISLGNGGGCAVLGNGRVKCWGDNFFGTLGNATTTSSLTPVFVSGISDAVEVSSGLLNNCARLSNGQLQCWGDNGNGSLTLPGGARLLSPALPVHTP